MREQLRERCRVIHVGEREASTTVTCVPAEWEAYREYMKFSPFIRAETAPRNARDGTRGIGISSPDAPFACLLDSQPRNAVRWKQVHVAGQRGQSVTPHTPPTYRADAFNCPHCGAFSQMGWRRLGVAMGSDDDEIEAAFCVRCRELTIWYTEKLIYPDIVVVPQPNADLDETIRADYLEAGTILNKSPRGAAALLRLCIQNLCKQLGENVKNINNDVAALVRRGLPIQVQQALDVVRVVGNNALHPGEIDLRDDRDTALRLFGLVNLIAQTMITNPKEVAQMFESLPEGTREAIEKRDAPKT